MAEAEKNCRCALSEGTLVLENDTFAYEVPNVAAVAEEKTYISGRVSPHVLFTARMTDGRERRFGLWPDIPFVWMPAYREESLLTLEGQHWIVRAVALQAYTDTHDALSNESIGHLFARNLPPMSGNIFFLEDPESGRAIVIVCEGADYQPATLTIRNGVARIEAGGADLALGFCACGECEQACRSYYRHACCRPTLLTMSNTWGDGNGYSRVCESFILREIDAAARLGVDIVQIDDGWQTGNTGDPSILDENKCRRFDGDFWKLSSEKFPHGMRYVTDYAAARGIRVGMWFAPDSHGHYAHLERDKDVLRRAYVEWGIRFFKLDMFWVHDEIDLQKIRELIDAIYSFGKDVDVQLDVTGHHARLGYLCCREYGTVFVENRYTKTANSYPHRILRNLWMLGHYLPTSRFQFELVNPALNQESYPASDPFAPAGYTMDYLFASVMLANPLFWMELQFLPAERQAELIPLVRIWQAHREHFVDKDILPLGDKPSGRSFSGFSANEKGRADYLLLFREVTGEASYIFRAPVKAGSRAVVLSSNAHVSLTVEDGAVRATFSSPRSYAFVQLISEE